MISSSSNAARQRAIDDRVGASSPDRSETLDQDPRYVRGAFASIAGRYVLANHVLSGGADLAWRRKVAARVRDFGPETVLDLATGSGDLAAEVSRMLPSATVVAADFCVPMLREARKRDLPSLVAADGMCLPFGDGAFDAVTVGYGLRNMAGWSGAITEMRRVLRPGGLLVVLDFSLPEGVLRGPYRWYLHRVLPRLAGWLTGNRAAYEYLGESIERFPSGREMEALLLEQGFREAIGEPLWGGISSLYSARA